MCVHHYIKQFELIVATPIGGLSRGLGHLSSGALVVRAKSHTARHTANTTAETNILQNLIS